jgi:tetratricopeptide (TPR) repeat protein
VALLVLVVTAGGAWAWEERQRQQRATRVDVALGEAEALTRQAVATGDDLVRWAVALKEVQNVGLMARDARNSVTRSRITQLAKTVVAESRAAEHDRVVLGRLIDIRSARADDRDGASTDAAYAEAFRSAGIAVDTLEPAEAAARVRRRPPASAASLVAGLDDWTESQFSRAARRGLSPRGTAWQRLVAIARAADDDATRAALRDALLVREANQRLARLKELTRRAPIEAWSPASLVLLARRLSGAGDPPNALAVLRRASVAHPGDVWVHYELGTLLERSRPPQTEEAIRAYSVARAIRPETAHELAHALEHRGRGEEAEAIFRDLVARRPNEARHLGCLGALLKARGRSAEAEQILGRAITAFRQIVRLRPDDAQTYKRLADALDEIGNTAEAESAYRETIRLQPDYPLAYYDFGMLVIRRDPVAAESLFREAIRRGLDVPYTAASYMALGNALDEQTRRKEAVVAYREAIRLKPDLALAHLNLGVTLLRLSNPAEAAAELRETIRLKPDHASAYYLLGAAMQDLGKPDEAESAYREAIRLRPGYAEAHCNLGHVLRRAGRYPEALEELHRGHELGSRQPGWTYPSAAWVAECEKAARLHSQLLSILKNGQSPR